MLKKIFIPFLLLLVTIKGATQNGAIDLAKSIKEKKEKAKQVAKENVADPNKNFKSIVTDLFNGGNGYYQALIKNGILKQGDGEVQVKSTIYGLIRIFDSTRREDKFFRKLRWVRNIQIGLGAVMGEENKISELNSSLTVALINKRVTNWKLFYEEISASDIEEVLVHIKKATDAADAIANRPNPAPNDIEESKKADKQIEEFSATLDFNKLSGLISDEEIETARAKWEKLTGKYDDIKKKISGAPLLTWGYEGNYGNNKWSKINNKLEFIAGFGSKKDSVRNYDFYAGAFYNITQDTLNILKVLNRTTFSAKAGINKVLAKAKSDGSSLIEVFGGGEYQNIIKGIYPNEVKSAFKFDLSLSFRVAQNLYLPFRLKWNTNTGKFEGLIDLKFDVLSLF
ncbi:MAG: hypothetical protein HYX40_00410 [Sphingobacteriales bacterium]|nr:hypothetical protein [Sphingobacteriales bacterium]